MRHIRANNTVGAYLLHFIKTDLYAAVPGLIFGSGCDPAYPLIAC